MTDRLTFVSFLLDETGSMGAIREETVTGLNDYVDSLRESDAEILFSLVSFNSNRTRRRYVAEPIAEVGRLSLEDYRPDAMTPLIDAAVKIIRATEEAVSARGDDAQVVVVMQTDGEENVSVEFDNRDLAALIKEKTAAGWEFVLLGAGMDAFGAARRAGIDIAPSRVASYGRTRSRQLFASIAENVRGFAESGAPEDLDFTEGQRRAFGRSAGSGLGKRLRRSGRKPPTERASTVDPIDLR